MALITWKPDTNGLWTDPNNWVGGVVPGAADTASFNSGTFNAASIDIGATVAVGDITVAPGVGTDINLQGTLDLAGTIALNANSGIEAFNSATGHEGAGVISGGTLDLSGGGGVSGVSVNAVTLVGTPPAGRYPFGPKAVTGGLTVLIPALTLDSGFDAVGNQTLSANLIEPFGVTIDGTLALAPGTTVENNPAYLNTGYALTFAPGASGSGTLVNDGNITDTSSLDIYVNLVNAGALEALGSFDDIAVAAIANSGTITAGATEDLILRSATVTNSGLLHVRGGGTIEVASTTLADAGGTIAVDAGATAFVPTDMLGGTVVSAGGTVNAGGGAIYNGFGTFDGVTLEGNFASLSGNAVGGTGFASQTPGVRASATLTAGLLYLADAVVDDVNLTLPEIAFSNESNLTSATALTLGPSSDIAFSGAPSSVDHAIVTAATSLVLGGTIEASSGNVYLGAGAGGIVNTGTVFTAAGETLTLGPAVLNIIETTSFANDGVLLIAAGSVVALNAKVTAAGFVGLTQSGATLEIGPTGTVDGSAAPGSTITFAAGSVVQTVGLIRNVTVADDTSLTVGGTLDGVTWQGLPLDVSDQGNTVIRNGLSVRNASGGPGSIVVGGTNSFLNLQTDTTLDNVNVTIGSTTAASGTQSFSLIDGTDPTSNTQANLTIGPNATVTIAGNDTFDGVQDVGTLSVLGTVYLGGAPSAAHLALASTTNADSGSSSGSSGSSSFAAGDLAITGAIIAGLAGNAGPSYVFNADTITSGQLVLGGLSELLGSGFANAFGSVGRTLGTAVVSASSPPSYLTSQYLSSIETTLDGTGSLEVANGGMVFVDAVTAPTVKLPFAASGGSFVIMDPTRTSGQFTNFGPGDGIDLSLYGYTAGTPTESNGQLVVPTGSGDVALNVGFASGYSIADVQTVDDTQGGTFAYIGGAPVITPPANLPDVSASFTSAVDAAIVAEENALIPAGTTPNVVSVSGAGAAGAAVAGTLNAYVVTSAPDGSTVTAPAGYALAYLFAGAATLADTAGNTALIDASVNATLIGQAGDTLFGDNANATMVASAGAETLFGGTGANLLELGASTAVANTQGSDTIVGSTTSATINAAGASLYFGATGDAVFNALGATATLVGGGAETVNAAAASTLLFAGAGALAFNAGTGLSTVVSGAAGAAITGGGGGLLYFGTGPTTYIAGSAVDTVLGFTGSLTATGGANGSLFFTGTAGNNDVATGAGSSTIIGFGANDTLTATGSGSDVIAAAGAAETIDGSQSSGINTFFAFGANDVVLGGAGETAIESGLGNHTLAAGGGSTLFEILAGTANRAITIANFSAAQDFVQLQGYGAGTGAAALRSASTAGGNEVLALPDGTQVTFVGVTNLTAAAFV